LGDVVLDGGKAGGGEGLFEVFDGLLEVAQAIGFLAGAIRSLPAGQWLRFVGTAGSCRGPTLM
jgi:hypothetical protein